MTAATFDAALLPSEPASPDAPGAPAPSRLPALLTGLASGFLNAALACSTALLLLHAFGPACPLAH